MIKLSEFGKNFVWTTKIELPIGEDGLENFIELREPTQQEIVNLSDDGAKNLEMMEKIFPACVTKSTFTKDDGTPATGKEIADVLKNSGSLFTEILSTWLNSIPFQHRLMKGEKSDK